MSKVGQEHEHSSLTSRCIFIDFWLPCDSTDSGERVVSVHFLILWLCNSEVRPERERERVLSDNEIHGEELNDFNDDGGEVSDVTLWF